MFTQLQMNAVQKGMQFTMVALPMFILMGQLVYHARIAEDLYDCVQKWFGRMPGGLAITSVAGCACFGAVTGSSVAAVATIAPMCMPEMRRYNTAMNLEHAPTPPAGPQATLF